MLPTVILKRQGSIPCKRATPKVGLLLWERWSYELAAVLVGGLILWEAYPVGGLISREGWCSGRADPVGGWSPGRADPLGGLIPWEDWRASWCSSPIQLLIMVNRRVDSDKQNSVCTIMPLLFSWFLAYTRFKFAQNRSKIFFPCGIFCLFVYDIPPPSLLGWTPPSPFTSWH